MTPYQLVNGDMKKFKFEDAHDPNIIYSIGYGVIETTDAEASLTRVDELIPEMQVVRHEMKLTAMLLAVVDIVHLTSTPFIAGPTEMSLALAAYGGETIDNGKALEVTGLVSRKKDFVPMLTRAVAAGWKPPPPEFSPVSRVSTEIVMDFSEFSPGRPKRKFEFDEFKEEKSDCF
jgi:inorganic pyrophosphatase/exopolyphosphatase